jgi:sensor histidine kinase regulating citrate/malate metabolism
MKKLVKKKEQFSIEIQSGSDIVNAIANNLIEENRDNGISVRWIGALPPQLNISNMDLCTVFSNILTNAFETAAPLPNDKIIEVTVKILRVNLCIR